ncbi:MAG: hypothetical protein H6706_06795 [Myxococcales bacterium]|nr:hypothetical protein [Myxococcales bacterium]
MIALALIATLAAPAGCPAEVGQIRWDDFSYTFQAQGKKVTVRGTLWDRDRNGKPSKGDLFRVDDARAGGEDLGASDVWAVLGGGLAGAFNARFKQIGRQLNATCESRFDVEDVPTVNGPDRLGALVLSTGGGGNADPVARLNGTMRGWAEEICAQKKHYDEDELARLLAERAARTERGFKGSTLRGEARTVAKDFGLKCAHLAVPKMTFD